MRSMFARCLLVLVVLACAQEARASFHVMQIEQVIGGVNGDVTAQAIQLRLRSANQHFVSGQCRLIAWDANGANPVVVHIFTGANPPNGAGGSRILICTPSFAAQTTPACVPDYIMSTLIPASYLAAGRLTFQDNFNTVYWSLAWGGVAYTGPHTGAPTNDANGNFGPAFPLPLPSTGSSALQFQGPFTAGSTTNAMDYAITAGAAVFTNNLAASFTVNSAPATGRCCTPDENCTVVTQVLCNLAGGDWTEGAACSPGDCAAGELGACCDGQVCTITTQAACEGAGHMFEGSAACTVDGPNNFVACCPANWSGDNGLDVPDIFQFLTAWFAGDEEAQNFGGTPGVPAIFAFLTAWFGGCS